MDKDSTFKQIIEENKNRMYRICCAYEHDEDNRDDLFQEMMINIWKSLDKFEGRSSINTWIYRIAVNTSLLHVKRSVKQNENNSRYDDSVLNIEDSAEDKEEKIRTYEQTKKLYECINVLAEIDRLIISMVLDDLSYKEIAEVTGLKVNNVGVKINRIKKELSKLMGVKENGN